MRILSLWLPNWPIQRLIIEQPNLKPRSVVLYQRDPRRGQRVAYCSRLARRQGIRRGMPLAEVETTIASQRAADTLHLSQHDPHDDRSTLEQLAVWCHQFSPVVGLDTWEPPSGLLIDVTHTARRLGGEDTLARNVLAAFSQRKYFSRVAIADTLGAAWALSRAKLDRDDRICTAPTGESAATLAPLPVALLRLSPDTLTLLDQLGIQQIGQLAKLPRPALRSRFGEELLLRLDQAFGRVAETMQSYRPLPQLTVSRTLEYATSKRVVMEKLVEQLTQRLAEKLSAQDLGVVQMECQLGCENGQAITICLGLYNPTANTRQLIELMQMRLEQKHFGSPIKRLRLTAIVTAPLCDDQHTLIDSVSPTRTKQLADLVNRLSCRLGRNGVVGVTFLAEPLVERSYYYTPLTGRRITAPSSTQRAMRHHPLAPGWRPLRLEDPPVPIRVMSVAAHGPPTKFELRGQTYIVDLYWGPERIETGWWRGATVRRDYWRVEDLAGYRFWLFQELRCREWFVQG